jgi:hypothetical protein
MNSRSLIANRYGLAHVRKINGGDAWKVENGTLHFDPTAKENNQGDLVTDKEYSNFHLKKIRVETKANSGIIFTSMKILSYKKIPMKQV